MALARAAVKSASERATTSRRSFSPVRPVNGRRLGFPIAACASTPASCMARNFTGPNPETRSSAKMAPRRSAPGHRPLQSGVCAATLPPPQQPLLQQQPHGFGPRWRWRAAGSPTVQFLDGRLVQPCFDKLRGHSSLTEPAPPLRFRPSGRGQRTVPHGLNSLFSVRGDWTGANSPPARGPAPRPSRSRTPEAAGRTRL